MVLEHNGAVKLGPVQLYDKATSPNGWSKPAVVTDFDGDGHADIANSSCNHFTIYHLNGRAVLGVLTAYSVTNVREDGHALIRR